MRINLTSMKENQKINEITKIIEQAFSKTNYKFKIIPCNYEQNIEKIKQYHKSYYIRNKDKIRKYHQEYNKKSARMTVHFLYTENSDRSCHSDQTHLHR